VKLSGTETILLTDNEDDLRNATAEYLESCGYRVLTACDGEQAIQAADSHRGRIALVISDIVMPRVNGRQLMEHVRRTRPETRVLMISGYAGDDITNYGITLDRSAFLQKPYTFQALGERIRAMLK
jgi:DNA-binding response OmpR family regulator